jgi:putative oxidoreductase
MNALLSYAAPLARLLMSAIFITSGAQKITAYAGTQGYMAAMGVPGGLLPLVIAVELLGGLALLVGFQTRIAAFLLAGFTVIAGVLFHFQPAEQMQMIMFWKNIAIAGGLLSFVLNGAGALSVDNRAAA